MDIEPVACFTCGKILGNLWDVYEEIVLKKTDVEPFLNINNTKQTAESKAFDKLNIKRYCCKRMFLGHKNISYKNIN